MAVEIALIGDSVVVELSGWDRMMNWRSKIVFYYATIESCSILDRSSLENLIDHRKLGFGSHDGRKRPNRRRVGTMLGRSTAGEQFWAVPGGGGGDRLLVLDLQDHEFVRAVLATEPMDEVIATITQSTTSSAGGQERPD